LAPVFPIQFSNPFATNGLPKTAPETNGQNWPQNGQKRSRNGQNAVKNGPKHPQNGHDFAQTRPIPSPGIPVDVLS
jgi:hypothetical protein